MSSTLETGIDDINAIKRRQKATWESGDFGQVAVYNLPGAEEFMDTTSRTVPTKLESWLNTSKSMPVECELSRLQNPLTP